MNLTTWAYTGSEGRCNEKTQKLNIHVVLYSVTKIKYSVSIDIDNQYMKPIYMSDGAASSTWNQYWGMGHWGHTLALHLPASA